MIRYLQAHFEAEVIVFRDNPFGEVAADQSADEEVGGRLERLGANPQRAERTE
jgi:hypothetical protein